MAYTIILTSAAEKINASDTLQLILTFTVNLVGTNESYSFDTKKLAVVDWGKLDWSFDIEDLLLTPGETRLRIDDLSGYLDGLLFGTKIYELSTDKAFKAELKLNGATEFIGFASENSIRSDQVGTTAFELRFTARPQIDLLNKKMIYGLSGEFLDPFDYTTASPLTISNATYASNKVTVTHTSDSTFDVGKTVHITGVVGMTDINGYHLITDEVSNTQFKIAKDTQQTYTSGGTATLIEGTTYWQFTKILEDMYQLVDSSITFASGKLSLRHNWTFNASGIVATPKNITGAMHSSGVVTVTHDFGAGLFPTGGTVMIEGVVGMTDLNAIFTVITHISDTQFTVSLTTSQTYTSGGTIKDMVLFTGLDKLLMGDNGLYFNTNSAENTIGLLLKKIATDWFCFTGMIHNQKAFFHKLFEYDATNIQTLGAVLSKTKKYDFQLIDYVKVSTDIVFKQSWEAGTFTALSNKNLIRDNLYPGFWVDYGAPQASGSNIRYTGTGNPHVISAHDSDRDSSYNAYGANGRLLADLWFKFKGDIAKLRVDTLEVVGVNYDFLKNFTYDGFKYQIISMKKDFEKNITTIDALNLGV